MKIRIIVYILFFICLMLILPVKNVSAASGNLLTNGDFETDNTDGWKFGNLNRAVIGSNAQNGSYFLDVSDCGSCPSVYGNEKTFTSDIAGIYTAGQKYSASVYFRSPLGGNVRLALWELGNTSELLGVSDLVGNSSWQKMEISDVPIRNGGNETLRVQIYINNIADGTNYNFDNFSLINNDLSVGSESVYDYLALQNPVINAVKHYHRKSTDANDPLINSWDTSGTSNSDQEYSYFRDTNGYWTFQRLDKSITPGKYVEKYIFDSAVDPRDSSFIDLTYGSGNGDMYPWMSDPAKCILTNLDGCDNFQPIGAKWLVNILPYQGYFFDSSTFSPNSHNWFQGGINRLTTHHRFYGQMWKWDDWNNTTFKHYISSLNTAKSIGWNDPDIGPEVTLDPKSVFIMRGYSDCDEAGGLPWSACNIFEDHIYAKDSFGNKLGEILVVIGYTPKHFNADYWGVYHFMITKTSSASPVPPSPTPTPIDFNTFLNQFKTYFNQLNPPSTVDLNNDGKADIFDYNAFIGNLGK